MYADASSIMVPQPGETEAKCGLAASARAEKTNYLSFLQRQANIPEDRTAFPGEPPAVPRRRAVCQVLYFQKGHRTS